MTGYYIGTASFTDKGLDGTFYPKGLKPAERITFYAKHFNAVEIDSSYYALTLEEWAVRIRNLAEHTGQVHIMFNNCMHTYPVQNARDMAGMLGTLTGKREVELIDQQGFGI